MSDSQDVADESSLATALGSAAFPAAVRLAGEAGSDVGDAQKKVTKTKSKTQKLRTKTVNTRPKIDRIGLAHSFTSIQAIIIEGS